MTEKEKRMMEAHGITSATRTVYSYKGYEYWYLDEAVRVAELHDQQAPLLENS